MIMTNKNSNTIEMLEGFIQGSQSVAFSVLGNKTERYNFILKTLIKFSYISLSKKKHCYSLLVENDRILTPTTYPVDQ